VIFLATIFYNLDTAITNERAASSHEAILVQLGRNLEAASHYLSWASREYVVTMNPKYLEKFWHEVDVVQHREAAIDRLQLLEAPTNEIRLLKRAKLVSDNLMETEIKAMKLILTVFGVSEEMMPPHVREYQLSAKDLNLSPNEKINAARMSLFDSTYNRKKKSAIEPLHNFQEVISTRSKQETALAIKTTNHIIAFSIFIAILMPLLSLFLWSSYRASKLKPLKSKTKEG